MNQSVVALDKMNESPTPGQVERLGSLIDDLFACCQERAVLHSDKFGLPQAELRVLLAFSGVRYLAAKDMAARLNVAKSRISLLTASMIEKGLLKRSPDPSDSRVALFALTREGQDLLSTVEAFRHKLHTTVLEQLDPQERRQLLSSLEALKGAMLEVRDLLE
jgi:DNA-binding MarR family transcriptional regulator